MIDSTRLKQIYDKLSPLWIAVFVIFMIINYLITLIAIAGLHQIHISYPNSFNHKYINYENLNMMFLLWVPFSLGFAVVSMIALTRKLSPKEVKP